MDIVEVKYNLSGVDCSGDSFVDATMKMDECWYEDVENDFGIEVLRCRKNNGIIAPESCFSEMSKS